MTTHIRQRHPFKSPTCGGGHPPQVGRGPTPPPPPTHPVTTALKSPQDWGDLGGPPRAQPPASPHQGKAEKSENAKTNLLSPRTQHLYVKESHAEEAPPGSAYSIVSNGELVGEGRRPEGRHWDAPGEPITFSCCRPSGTDDSVAASHSVVNIMQSICTIIAHE